MENKASLTALLSLFGRAYHAGQDRPVLFDDGLSRALMTEEEYRQIREYLLSGIDFFAPEKKGTFASEEAMLRWIVQTQLAPTPLARARYCEDALETAARTGTVQYVILGAGMDTFAFRKPDSGLRVFEVDHPLTQADKRVRIRRAGWTEPPSLRFVPADLTRDRLSDRLLEAGFRPEEKTFFSWLGVSYYLTPAQIEATLAELASIAADGSSLLFDYGEAGLFRSPVRRVQNMLAMAAAGGEPMQSCFSYEALERLLERHGFLIYEHLDPAEIQARFFADRTDDLTAFEEIGCVLAVWKRS